MTTLKMLRSPWRYGFPRVTLRACEIQELFRVPRWLEESVQTVASTAGPPKVIGTPVTYTCAIVVALSIVRSTNSL